MRGVNRNLPGFVVELKLKVKGGVEAGGEKVKPSLKTRDQFYKIIRL